MPFCRLSCGRKPVHQMPSALVRPSRVRKMTLPSVVPLSPSMSTSQRSIRLAFGSANTSTYSRVSIPV